MSVMDVEDQHETSQLPGTQRVDSDYGSCDIDEETTEIWGRLYPIGFNLEPKDLTKQTYQVGRGPDCDVTITSRQVDPAILAVISKVQFQLEIEIDNSGARIFSLLDLSSNGTFVNKNKIGKNKKIYLSNNDEIALSQPQNKAYLFVDAFTCNSWLPFLERRNYSIITGLGHGAFGEVQLAIEKRTGMRFAIKKILKNICNNGEDKNQVANEIKILGTVNHPCTIKMEDVFENDESVYIVLEYMPGGDLQQRIDKVKIINESDSKFYFYQLMLGLQYLHNNEIIHRDLKPKNVLLSMDSSEALLKISDFGLSKVMKSASTLKTFCGTLMYTAPEILLSKGCSAYTPSIDVWSLGCILYQCLSGKAPFNIGHKTMPIQEQIVRGYFPRLWNHQELVLSESAIDLVDKMLVVSAAQRISVDDILKHPWLQDKSMKSRFEKVLLNVGKENLESVSPEFENLKKRRRTEFAVTMTS